MVKLAIDRSKDFPYEASPPLEFLFAEGSTKHFSYLKHNFRRAITADLTVSDLGKNDVEESLQKIWESVEERFH